MLSNGILSLFHYFFFLFRMQETKGGKKGDCLWVDKPGVQQVRNQTGLMIESIKVQKVKSANIQSMKRSWLQAAVAVDFSSNLLVTGRAPKIAQRLQISGSKVTLRLANLPQRLASSILYERCISTSLPSKLHNTYGKSTNSTKKAKMFAFCIYFYSNYPSASFLFVAKDLNNQLKGSIHDTWCMCHHGPSSYWKLSWFGCVFKTRHQLLQVPFVHVPFLEVLRSSQSSPGRLIKSHRIRRRGSKMQQIAACVLVCSASDI